LEDFLRKEQEVKSNITVLGIPRGGVVIADIVATKLKASDFDIIIPRKLRIPYNEEAAFGAIMEDGTVYIEDRIVKDLDISQEYIEEEKNIQLEEIKHRSILYTEKKELSEQQQQEQQLVKEEGEENKIKEEDNKITILVDDGTASGSTIIAAARSIRKKVRQRD
jgi:putative phosphoribosyl transferase